MISIKNYGKKTKRMIRVALAIKGIAGALTASAYVMGREHLAFAILIFGAIANEIVNILKDEETTAADNSN